MALGVLLFLIAAFVLVNTLNGNFPGLIGTSAKPAQTQLNSLSNIQSQSDVNLQALRSLNTALGN